MNQNFLSNPICKFEILNNKNLIRENINVVVSSFFKREQYYKNFNIYVNGLQKTLKYFSKKTDYVYLIFIDENIRNDNNIMKIIKECPNCVPVLFKCSKYMKDKYHYDLFGTLVRFFPMFDFDNNPCKKVVCVDIDLNNDDLFRLDSIIQNDFKGVVGAGIIVDHIKNNIQNPPYIFAGLLSYNIEKTDHKIIIDYIENIDKNKSKGYYGKRETDFGFGVDEIFINDILLPKIGSIGVIIDYQISYLMFHSKDRIMNNKQSNNILSLILGKYDNDKFTINDKYNFIDKQTYHVRTKNKINKTISKRFSKVIKYLYEHKLKWIDTNFIKFIYKYLLNVVSATVVINYDYNKHAITYAQLNDLVKV